MSRWTDRALVDSARHFAVVEYADELLRQAGVPGLTAQERRELLEEARAAEAVAVQIREAA